MISIAVISRNKIIALRINTTNIKNLFNFHSPLPT
nr:MAG TPA: hypothetical protein [Caudoviricetes sp.]